MTDTVSISELRNNISTYLNRVISGGKVLIRDQKRQQTVAQITPVHAFDKQAYEKALRRAAGVFRVENHPEWRTKKDVSRWLEKSRLADERTF